MDKIKDIVAIVIVICIGYATINLINDVDKMITSSDKIEYQYKDWSSNDIELGMKYHGIDSVIITEKEVYFIRGKIKHDLFTDECIEWIIKQKQKGE